MAEEEPKSPILISEIHLQNLLSFGPDAKPIPLGPLNVLIGANGSGKSNLIEAIALLRALPKGDLRKFFSQGGGVDEWIWKGEPLKESLILGMNRVAKIRVVIPNEQFGNIAHKFLFKSARGYFEVDSEAIGQLSGDKENSFLFRGEDFGTIISFGNGGSSIERKFRPDSSALAEIKDSLAYPVFSLVEETYAGIKIYREFQFGRNASIRQLQPKNMLDDSLAEDFSNLALFLKRILGDPAVKEKFIKCLKELYDGLTDIEFFDLGEWIQVFIWEGEYKFPATRLSDGTMRYLCLLAILLDPNPSPLICLEEPEIGLHLDQLPMVAELLIDASKRTQMIVTTHSDVIVNALSDIPESVYVCEKHEGKTVIQRLDREEVTPFLERYKLGELWMSGGIGGTRW